MEITLNFKQEAPNAYVAEAYVESRYALHIEQETFGSLRLMLKSVATGKYAECEDQLRMASVQNPVFDKDFNHGVLSEDCPKWIKIISRTPVSRAWIVGELVEAR